MEVSKVRRGFYLGSRHRGVIRDEVSDGRGFYLDSCARSSICSHRSQGHICRAQQCVHEAVFGFCAECVASALVFNRRLCFGFLGGEGSSLSVFERNFGSAASDFEGMLGIRQECRSVGNER
jgi:hypothetical protein